MSKIIILISFFITIPVIAQFTDEGYWESQNVFDDHSIGTVEIQIEPESLDYLVSNFESDTTFSATFIFTNRHIHGDTVKNVGLRLQGTTSRKANKKSFKIDFNEYIKGQKFYGLEKLNLKAVFTDPSVIRAKLYSDVACAFAVPCFRANHVKLYINGEYRGLYINVEHIDENFVRMRFNNNDGNLYKCSYGADLTYQGSDQAEYKNLTNQFGNKVYELKTNERANDFSDIAHFIEILNHASEESYKEEIEKVFNVIGFLRCMAVDVMSGNWDNYWFYGNNYYLYHNSATGIFEWLPFDGDETFGVWWESKDFARCKIYTWGKDWKHPLMRNMMRVEVYHNIFSHFIRELAQKICRPEHLEASIDSIHDMITPALETDPYYGTDYRFSIEDFHRSYNESLLATFDHVHYGLKSFISTRHYYALKQLDFLPLAPIILHSSRRPAMPTSQESIIITSEIIDDRDSTTAVVRYDNGHGFQEVEMFDDGDHGDGITGDNLFGAVIPPQSPGAMIHFYIQANDNHGNIATNPENAPAEIFTFRTAAQTPILYINEFMTSNNSCHADEFGEFDDWIELYNDEDTTVSLKGMHLTDDLSNPTKWELPDTTIEPNGFLLVWADNQPQQGALHTNFKLNDKGEQIGLFDARDNGNVLIDTLTYGLQTTNISFGRKTDGDILWTYFTTPTPGLSNAIKKDTTNLLIYNVIVDSITASSAIISWRTNKPSNSVVTYGLSPDSLQYTMGDSQQVTRHNIPLTELFPDTTYNFRVHCHDPHGFERWSEPFSFSTFNLSDSLNITLQIEVMSHRTDGCYEAPGWNFGNNGRVSQSLEFKRRGLYKFTVSARGEPAKGIWPEFQLSLDDTTLASKTVHVSDFDTLSVTAMVDSGWCEISIGFTNYFSDSAEIRSLSVDWLRIQYLYSPVSSIRAEEDVQVPDGLVLLQNYPNPANPMTRIQFLLPQSTKVSLQIFDLNGRNVKTLLNSSCEAGLNSVIWDGGDDLGQPVASGIYLYRIEVNGVIQTKKVIILK